MNSKDMKHWKALTPENNEYLGHWSILNLGVEEIEVTIESVDSKVVELLNPRTKRPEKTRKMFIKFKEFDLPMMQNVVNPTQIEANLGTGDHNLWIGEQITIFATIAERNGKKCIRVRPQAPKPIDFDSIKADLLKVDNKQGLKDAFKALPKRAQTKDLINYITDLAKQLA